MKATLLALLIMPSVGYCASQADVQQAITQIAAIEKTSSQLSNLLHNADALISVNWQIPVSFSTNTLTVPLSYRQDMLGRYQDLKSQLQSQVDALP